MLRYLAIWDESSTFAATKIEKIEKIMKRQNKSEIGRLIGKDINRLLYEVRTLKKDLILEYAASREDVAKAVCVITPTLIQHWCLVRYCTLVGRTETKNHWKGEVYNYIYSIARKKVKPSNNRDIVEKIIRKEWFDIDELHTDLEKVVDLLSYKFKLEKISLSDDELVSYAKEFQAAMPDIIHQMAYGDKDSITDYVEAI